MRLCVGVVLAAESALLLLGMVLLLAGCAQERQAPVHLRRCQVDRQCPQGRFCRDGLCASSPSRPEVVARDAGSPPELDRDVVLAQDLPEFFDPIEPIGVP